MNAQFIYAKLCEIKARPKLFLSEQNLQNLKAFIDGYAMRDQEVCDGVGFMYMDGFQSYVACKYGVTATISWARIINLQCTSDDAAFALFFELLEEYQHTAS